QRALVGVANKNGIYYVFSRASLDRGPVARLRIATGGNPPTSGNGTISPSAVDGARLYVGGGHIAIGGQVVAGTVSAYDPNDLAAADGVTGSSGGPALLHHPDDRGDGRAVPHIQAGIRRNRDRHRQEPRERHRSAAQLPGGRDLEHRCAASHPGRPRGGVRRRAGGGIERGIGEERHLSDRDS